MRLAARAPMTSGGRPPGRAAAGFAPGWRAGRAALIADSDAGCGSLPAMYGPVKRDEWSQPSVPIRVNQSRVAFSNARSEGVFCAIPTLPSPISRSTGLPSRRRSTAAWFTTRILGGALLSEARAKACCFATCMFCMTPARFTVNCTPKSIFWSCAAAGEASERSAKVVRPTRRFESSISPAGGSLSMSAVKNMAPYSAAAGAGFCTLNAQRPVARVPTIVSNCGVKSV